MKQLAVVVAALALASLAPSSWAQTSQPFQFAVVPGSAQWSPITARVNTATGETTLIVLGAQPVPVVDAAPPGPGAYSISVYATFDYGATSREWSVFRFDARSGRAWALNFDGKTTASWAVMLPGR